MHISIYQAYGQLLWQKYGWRQVESKLNKQGIGGRTVGANKGAEPSAADDDQGVTSQRPTKNARAANDGFHGTVISHSLFSLRQSRVAICGDPFF